MCALMVPGSALSRDASGAPRALAGCRVAPHDLSLHLELRYGVSVGLLHFQGGNAAGWRHRIVEAGPGASSGHLLRGGLPRGHAPSAEHLRAETLSGGFFPGWSSVLGGIDEFPGFREISSCATT
jgi:hypothetical protein